MCGPFFYDVSPQLRISKGWRFYTLSFNAQDESTLYFNGVLLDPWQQVVEITRSILKRANDKSMCGVGFNSELPAMEPQEDIAEKKRCTFITIHKSMIADQGLKQGS